MKIYYPQKQPLIVSAKKLFSKFQEICQENIRVRLQFLQNLGFMLILRKGAVFYPNVLGSNGLNIFVCMNIFKLQTSYVTIKAKFLKSHKYIIRLSTHTYPIMVKYRTFLIFAFFKFCPFSGRLEIREKQRNNEKHMYFS